MFLLVRLTPVPIFCKRTATGGMSSCNNGDKLRALIKHFFYSFHMLLFNISFYLIIKILFIILSNTYLRYLRMTQLQLKLIATISWNWCSLTQKPLPSEGYSVFLKLFYRMCWFNFLFMEAVVCSALKLCVLRGVTCILSTPFISVRVKYILQYPGKSN